MQLQILEFIYKFVPSNMNKQTNKIIFCMGKENNLVLSFLLMLFICLTVSCNNKNKTLNLNVIPVASTVGNYKILNLSDYITEIKYIPLETNDSVLIGRISQISYENEKILIKDAANLTYNCYLFDDKGNFCCKIGNYGQGPDDYLDIRHTFMLKNYIYLMDAIGSKLLIYNTKGFLVENNDLRIYEITEKNSEYYMYFHIFPLKKDTFVMNISSPFGYYPKAILLETDHSNSKIIREYQNYIKIDKKQPGGTICEFGNMYRFKDDVRTYKAINDTIFTIDQSSEMKESFIFELDKFRPTLSFIEQKEPIATSKNYIIPIDIFESFDHLFINFYFGNHAPEPYEFTNRIGLQTTNNDVYGVFNKNTGELSLMKQPIKGKFGFKNDIDSGPVIWPHYISSNNKLVTHISAEEFIDYYEKVENPTPQMTEIAKNLKMDDNPIVIIAKLKEKDHGTD